MAHPADSPPAAAAPGGQPPPSVARRAAPARLVAAVVVLTAAIWLVLDQATKGLAVALLSDRTVDMGFFDFHLVRNPGGAFSIPGFPGLFVIVTVVVVVLVARAVPHTDRLSLAFAYGWLTGGALGNVADRIFRAPGFPSGHVVDFFDLRWFPVFNVADIGITCGAILVVVLMSRVDREQRAAQAGRAATAHRSVRPDTSSPRR